MAEKRIYRVKEIQDILDISRPAVYDLIKRGEFKYIVAAGRYLISKQSFDDWLNNPTPTPAREKKTCS